MTVSLTYDATLSRVRIAADGLGSALTATVQRSTNQIRWTAVRGGVDQPVTGCEIATVDDYEFKPNVANYYRVSYYAPTSFVAAGTTALSNNGAAVVPGLPAGQLAGDTLFLFAGIRNSGLGVVDVPAGYTAIADLGGNAKLMAK